MCSVCAARAIEGNSGSDFKDRDAGCRQAVFECWKSLSCHSVSLCRGSKSFLDLPGAYSVGVGSPIQCRCKAFDQKIDFGMSHDERGAR